MSIVVIFWIVELFIIITIKCSKNKILKKGSD